jgi:hypothetical protein
MGASYQLVGALDSVFGRRSVVQVWRARGAQVARKRKPTGSGPWVRLFVGLVGSLRQRLAASTLLAPTILAIGIAAAG